jgi:3-deoxy-D-manno-octulosonic-acid transferase
MIIAASARSVPLILVNGRLSERSFHRWRMLPRTIGALLRRFDLCLAQSTDDGARYAGLGAPRIATSGNLKLDVPAPSVDEAKLAVLRDMIGNRPVIAATSTHPGEETVVIDAHRRLKHSFPGLLTVVAPRHPERGQGIVDIAKVSGLNAALRSRNELPRPSTDIYIADTLGELGLIYRLTRIVFVGGSLVSHGGQNPIEAVKLGAAVLHGPHVSNFAEIYSVLDAAGGAEEVLDSTKLTLRIGGWLKDATARQAVADKALKSMEILAGALERTVTALEPYLMEFRLDRRADNA